MNFLYGVLTGLALFGGLFVILKLRSAAVSQKPYVSPPQVEEELQKAAEKREENLKEKTEENKKLSPEEKANKVNDALGRYL